VSDEFPVSPLFRAEDQPPVEDLAQAERLAGLDGTTIPIPFVHQQPNTVRINQDGSRAMVTLSCPTCKLVIGCFEDELPHSLDTHHPSCGGRHGQPHELTVMKVTRYGSGPIDLILG
jgi:hypothetical protein